MFSHTAYEAMYQYLGLSLHYRLVQILTSEAFFKGAILFLFAFMFFLTTAQFFSRYMPHALVKRRAVHLSQYFKLIFCLFLGISLLKVGTTTTVMNFKRESWHHNQYVRSNMKEAQPNYRVSFVFDILSSSAEEVSFFLAKVIDRLFSKTHSQLEAPNFFYKAIMFAGTATIENPKLKDSLQFYTEECFEKVIPFGQTKNGSSLLDQFFGPGRYIDDKLQEIKIVIPLENGASSKTNCLNIKNDVRSNLINYSQSKAGMFRQYLNSGGLDKTLDYSVWQNMQASGLLVNHFMEQQEDFLGIKEKSKVGGGAGRIFQGINRLFSWDGLLSLFDKQKYHGAALSAMRGQEFSENLSRAPHVAGFVKLLLIIIFPFLVFFVIAGKWKVLIYWLLTYFSVLLWNPLWTLLYHIVTNITLSNEMMDAFGKLHDGVSLYSSQIITSRIYYLYSVYSWLQILLGPALTGMMIFMIRPMLADTKNEESPDFIGGSSQTVSTGAKVLGGGL